VTGDLVYVIFNSSTTQHVLHVFAFMDWQIHCQYGNNIYFQRSNFTRDLQFTNLNSI